MSKVLPLLALCLAPVAAAAQTDDSPEERLYDAMSGCLAALGEGEAAFAELGLAFADGLFPDQRVAKLSLGAAAASVILFDAPDERSCSVMGIVQPARDDIRPTLPWTAAEPVATIWIDALAEALDPDSRMDGPTGTMLTLCAADEMVTVSAGPIELGGAPVLNASVALRVPPMFPCTP